MQQDCLVGVKDNQLSREIAQVHHSPQFKESLRVKVMAAAAEQRLLATIYSSML